MNVIQERLSALRALMKEQGMDAYLVPTADYHETEYVGEHFKCRKYITGFTGSSGTAVVTMDQACLWTDGRYFVQASHELEGSSVTMMKMGMKAFPRLRNIWTRSFRPEAVLDLTAAWSMRPLV